MDHGCPGTFISTRKDQKDRQREWLGIDEVGWRHCHDTPIPRITASASPLYSKINCIWCEHCNHCTSVPIISIIPIHSTGQWQGSTQLPPQSRTSAQQRIPAQELHQRPWKCSSCRAITHKKWDAGPSFSSNHEPFQAFPITKQSQFTPWI